MASLVPMDDLVAQMTLQNQTEAQWDHVVDSVRGLPRSRLPQLWAKLVEQLAMNPPPIRGDVSQDQWMQLCHAQYREVYRCALRDAGVDNENTLAPSSGGGGGPLDTEKFKESVESLAEAIKNQKDSTDLVDKMRDAVTALAGVGKQVTLEEIKSELGKDTLKVDEIDKKLEGLKEVQDILKTLDVKQTQDASTRQVITELSEVARVKKEETDKSISDLRSFVELETSRLLNQSRTTHSKYQGGMDKSLDAVTTIAEKYSEAMEIMKVTDASYQVEMERSLSIATVLAETCRECMTQLKFTEKSIAYGLANFRKTAGNDLKAQIETFTDIMEKRNIKRDQHYDKQLKETVDQLKQSITGELTTMNQTITELKTTVDSLKQGISGVQAADFASLSTKVNENQAAIVALENELKTHIAPLTQSINDLAVATLAKFDDINHNTQASVDQLKQSMTQSSLALEAKITENSSRITETSTSLQAQIQQHKTENDVALKLATDVTDLLKVKVDNVDSEVRRIGVNVNILSTSFGTIGATMEKITTSFTKVDERLNAVSGQVNAMPADLATNIAAACNVLEAKLEKRIEPVAVSAGNADRLTLFLTGRMNGLEKAVEDIRKEVDIDHTITMELRHQDSQKQPDPPHPVQSPKVESPVAEEVMTQDLNTDMWKQTWPVTEQQAQLEAYRSAKKPKAFSSGSKSHEYMAILCKDDEKNQLKEYLQALAVEAIHDPNMASKPRGLGHTILNDTDFQILSATPTPKTTRSKYFFNETKGGYLWINKTVAIDFSLKQLDLFVAPSPGTPVTPPSGFKTPRQKVQELMALVNSLDVIPAGLLILGLDYYYKKHLSTPVYSLPHVKTDRIVSFSGIEEGKFSMSVTLFDRIRLLTPEKAGVIYKSSLPPLLWDPDHFFDSFDLR